MGYDVLSSRVKVDKCVFNKLTSKHVGSRIILCETIFRLHLDISCWSSHPFSLMAKYNTPTPKNTGCQVRCWDFSRSPRHEHYRLCSQIINAETNDDSRFLTLTFRSVWWRCCNSCTDPLEWNINNPIETTTTESHLSKVQLTASETQLRDAVIRFVNSFRSSSG